MIAIRARIVERTATAVVLDPETGEPTGEEKTATVLEVEDVERPWAAVRTGPPKKDLEQVLFVEEDQLRAEDARRCSPDDFPPRPEVGVLVDGFPPVVPAGWRSARVAADGTLYEADPQTGKPFVLAPDPKPIGDLERDG